MTHDTLVNIFAEEVSPHVFELLPKLIVLSLYPADARTFSMPVLYAYSLVRAIARSLFLIGLSTSPFKATALKALLQMDLPHEFFKSSQMSVRCFKFL